MPPRKRKPSAGSSSATKLSFLPLLNKPAEAIGDYIKIQGKEWTGCPAADKDKMFVCIVRQYEAVHNFGAFKSQGFEVQEMGESGEGSLEPGVASGGKFWVAYAQPFLKYYYAAHPDRLPDGHPDKPEAAAKPAAPAAADAPKTVDTTDDGLPVVKQDAPVFKLFQCESDKLCSKTGANFGKRQQVWVCNICPVGGDPCGAKRTLTFAEPNQAPSNSNLITHVRAEAQKCGAHAVALEQLNEASKNQVLVDGSWQTVFSFEEAFPHHVRYVMMVATAEISAVTGQKSMFRQYVSGYEPRATFPHHETQHRIAECIAELQAEEQAVRRRESRKEFGNLPHRGWQLDMWTDKNTHTSYGCITETDVQEPSHEYLKKLRPDAVPQLLLRSGVVAFEQFPESEHTADNIREWLHQVAKEKGVNLTTDLVGITPDGAADGQAALNSMEELREKTDTCDLHRLQRSIAYSIGTAGARSKNDQAKELLRKESRLVTLSNQSRAVNDDIRNTQIAAGIPPHKILTTTRTQATRWGGTYLQLEQNHLLHPVLHPAVEKYKRQNRGKPDAIVDRDESESAGAAAGRAGSAVPAAQLGLSATDWDEGIEMAAFLERPYQIKELIEKGKQGAGLITGAQSLMLMHGLRASCEAGKPLSVKLLPPSPSLNDRERRSEQRDTSQLWGPA